MWPFGRKDVATRLAAVEERTEVEVVLNVVSPNAVASPITGVRAAMLHIEVLEQLSCELAEPGVRRAEGQHLGGWGKRERRGIRSRGPAHASLGVAVLGDVVTFRDAEGTSLSLLARRAKFRFAGPDVALSPLTKMPEGLATAMRSTEDRGPLFYREVPVREGDRVRVQAFVEPSHHVGEHGYRSLPHVVFVARDDVAPVFIEVSTQRS
jgi:hypothetical protein